MTGKALPFSKKYFVLAMFTVLGNLTDIIINVDINVCVDVDDGVGLVVDGDVDVAVDVGGDFTISFVRPALDGRRQKQPLTAGTYSTASQPGLTFKDFQTICKKKSFFLIGRFSRICPDKQFAKKRSTVMLYTVSVPLVIFSIALRI